MDIEHLGQWRFGGTQATADTLLRLVLDGKKTATASSLLGYEKENTPLPQAGECSVITYWDGTPGCVVRTTNVRVIPYKDMTFADARLEGEDDTLESWQKNHAAFWLAEGKKNGYRFSEDMPVVFEEFEVVEILQAKRHGPKQTV